MQKETMMQKQVQMTLLIRCMCLFHQEEEDERKGRVRIDGTVTGLTGSSSETDRHFRFEP